MSAVQLLSLAVLYGYIYAFLARGTVSRVMDADPSYRERWPRPTWIASGRSALAVLHVMFNMNLPRSGYPRSLQWRIWVARVMLWLSPFVLLAVLFFSPHGGAK